MKQRGWAVFFISVLLVVLSAGPVPLALAQGPDEGSANGTQPEETGDVPGDDGAEPENGEIPDDDETGPTPTPEEADPPATPTTDGAPPADVTKTADPTATENATAPPPPTTTTTTTDASTTATTDNSTKTPPVTTTAEATEEPNRAPTIGPIGDKELILGEMVTFTIPASDPDGDDLSFFIDPMPDGATFKFPTRIFFWTPEEPGEYTITFTVKDPADASASETITITVLEPEDSNRAPVLDAIGDKTVQSGKTLTFTVSAADPDGDSLTYTASGLPDGATFGDRTLTWTPSTAGTFSVTFTVSDGEASDSETVTITVTETEVGEWVVLFSYDEDPGVWMGGTLDGKNSRDGWGQDSYRAYTGSNSMYCAGRYKDPPAQYGNNMGTKIFTQGTRNLSGCTKAEFSFYYWMKTEAGHDALRVFVSVWGDNESTYYGGVLSGDSGGWQYYSFDLTDVPGAGNLCGQTQITVGLVFESDGGVTDEGVYVDNVVLRKFIPYNYPRITAIDPPAASAGTHTPVTIKGRGFGKSGPGSYVRFTRNYTNDLVAKILSWSNTEIVCEVPGGANSCDALSGVTVTTPAGTSQGFPFTVTFACLGTKWNTNVVKFYVVDNSRNSDGFVQAIIDAAQVWNDVDGADFYFEFAGILDDIDTATAMSQLRNNGVNEVFWISAGDGPYASEGAALCFRRLGGGSVVENDTAFDDYFPWTTLEGEEFFNVRNTAAHEFGHWLGLDDLFGHLDRDKLMGIDNPGLTEADMEGMRWLYPGPGTNGQYHVKVTNTSDVEQTVYYRLDTDPAFSGALVVAAGETVTSWRRVAPAGEHRVILAWSNSGASSTPTQSSSKQTIAVEGDTEYTFTIGPEATNHPPVLNPIGDKAVEAGKTLMFTVWGTDPDGDSLVVTAAKLPQGATFASQDHKFTWTPSQTGVYSGISFTISDGELTDSEEITVTVKAQATQPAITATTPAASQPSSGGGSGGSGTDTKRFTPVADSCDQEGVLWEDVTALSVDVQCELTLLQGTTIVNANGYPINAVTVTTIAEPGDAPEGMAFIGHVYEFSPRGTSISPSANLTLAYEAVDVPRGVLGQDIAVAIYDHETGEWRRLESSADAENRRVSAAVTGFSRFVLMAGIRPAAFDIGKPDIVPGEVRQNGDVSVTVTVTNTGDLGGDCALVCRLDGEVFTTRMVKVPGGGIEDVEFAVPALSTGVHTVEINGATADFTVVPGPASFQAGALRITPDSAGPGDTIIVSMAVVNTGETSGEYVLDLIIDGSKQESRMVELGPGQSEEVAFEVTASEPGTHRVDLNGQTGTFEVIAPPPETRTILEATAAPAAETATTTPEEALEETPEEPASKRSTIIWILFGVAAGSALAVTLVGYRMYQKRKP